MRYAWRVKHTCYAIRDAADAAISAADILR